MKNEISQLSKFILKCLRVLLKSELFEELSGDMQERYHDNQKQFSQRKANYLFLFDAIKCIKPGLIKTPGLGITINGASLLNHYWKNGYRSLFQNKSHTAFNLFGLMIGMGVFLSILQYVHIELSYDQFHDNHENIYRVVIKESNSNTKETYPDGIGYGFAKAAASEIPEIKQFVRKEHINRTTTITNNLTKGVFSEDVNNLFFVDSTFFSVFNFPISRGNKTSVFQNKYSIVITEKTAQKYFGNENPIGKTLNISGPPSPGNYQVTGVLKNPRVNSHLQFEFLLPMNNYIDHGWGGAVRKNGGWLGFNVVTYFVIEKESDLDLVESKLNKLIAKNMQEEESNDIAKEVILQPIANIYMGSNEFSYAGHLKETGSFENIVILTIIGFFILVIAWINYINLTTSRSIERMKEVAIRKTLGAQKIQLIYQFLVEAILFNIIAGALAIGLSLLLLPILSSIVGKELESSIMYLPKFWFVFTAVLLVGSLISGLYPAFALSSFRPIKIFKQGQSSSRNFNLRHGLLVFQFLSSIGLIAATYLLYKQTSFMKNKELTMDLEQILIVKGPRVTTNQETGVASFQSFRNELPKHHAINDVTGSLCVPGQFWTSGLRRNIQTPISEAPHSRGFYVTLNFENTYGLEFLAGKSFSNIMADEQVVIINEAALSTYGFNSPQEAINQKLIGVKADNIKRIVGVVKNFHWHSLHEDHTPYVIGLYENRLTENISIHINSDNVSETISYIENSFTEYFPGNPFEYYFADAALNRHYEREEQMSQILLVFSVLAVIVACIGLFALISNAINVRIKEIGIRKVLGASIQNLIILLSNELFKLLALAIFLIIPIIWIGANWWLESYAYRISISIDLFLLPALILISVAFLTVSYKTLNSALANPIKCLRSE